MHKKIKISDQCFTQKGFNEAGCYGCDCNDSCCKFGADFDKESYDLVIANNEEIEKLVNRKIEDCFEKEWSNDSEFLGNNSIRSVKGDHGYCIFHNTEGKGCILYKLESQGKINRRIIPSICRLFPLSWENGNLIVYHEQKDSVIPHDCNCVESINTTSKNILETQKEEILDIFNLDVLTS
jgi:hypothetical protein